jgi:pSer/pThr/pTyr-binding forkhead associated (FHA) protein
MDNQPIEDAGHALPAPHAEVRSEVGAGFVPLRFVVDPGKARVEVRRKHAILGRHSGAEVRLAFPEVSRRHARVHYANGQWRIVDLDSLNGVWNAALYDGDSIRIGSCLLTVEQAAAVRVVTPLRQNDPDLEVLKKIADVFPRKAS